jgi:hypothetical protein
VFLTADVRKLKSSAFVCHGYVLVAILLSIYFYTDVCMIIQKVQRIAAEIFRHTVVSQSENGTTDIPTHFV